MKVNDIIGTLLIGVGVSFIFAGALHRWYGIFAGVAYVIGAIIAMLIRNKKKSK